MTIVGFPIDNVNNTGETMRPALAALMGYAPSGRPVGANTGVRPGTPTSTGSVTSSTYSIAPHCGILDLETAAVAGPYLYAVTATETYSITAASTANPRVDLVTIRTNDPLEDSTTTPGVTLQYYAGTPAASPVAPSTPTGEYALMTISVPTSGTGAPSATWVARSWDDSGWLPLTYDNGYQSVGGVAGVRQIGGRIEFRGAIGPTSGSFSTNGIYEVATLPASIATPAASGPGVQCIATGYNGSPAALGQFYIPAGSRSLRYSVVGSAGGVAWLSNLSYRAD